MDLKDMEMETEMEMETSSSTSSGIGGAVAENHQHRQQVQAFNENAMDLLVRAQHLINQGKPALALQAVVMAVKTEGGDEAVARIMQRAREMYLNKLQANDAADQLASLFAECAIAEAQPVRAEPPTTTDAKGNSRGGSSVVSDTDETSILAESGREQVVFDACLDGSSFVCVQCGGLVSNLRREEHVAYWCCRPT